MLDVSRNRIIQGTFTIIPLRVRGWKVETRRDFLFVDKVRKNNLPKLSLAQPYQIHEDHPLHLFAGRLARRPIRYAQR